MVIAFGIRVEGEGFDLPDLSLPWGQDGVIDAVADANPTTIVVLETGNPVSMPWRDKVKAIVQAWYPGQAGGRAIAEVGYRWFAKAGAKPLYAFGHGLSYTTFAYGDLVVNGGDTITASFTVTNTGDREGADVPQLYLTNAAGEERRRLIGFDRVELAPGETRRVTITADPRLLARFDGHAGPLGRRRRPPPRRGRHLRRGARCARG